MKFYCIVEITGNFERGCEIQETNKVFFFNNENGSENGSDGADFPKNIEGEEICGCHCWVLGYHGKRFSQ